MDKCKELINKLNNNHILNFEEYLYLIKNKEICSEYLFSKARVIRDSVYGKKVYIRGLIEFTNYCKNNCLYCGIRRDNKNIDRYRLSKEEIIECADYGYNLGFRTFVMQGGEDLFYSDELLSSIVSSVKDRHPDTAITLSIGERSYESYKILKFAGADRFLLRHETCSKSHYEKLHPKEMSFDNRIECLKNLKALGYQVGCGFMVGSPYQTYDDLASELLFLKDLNPHMVGIGPFITHKDTPFKNKDSGSVDITLFMLGLIRLTLPNVLLPATTALGTLDPLRKRKRNKCWCKCIDAKSFTT